MEISVNVLTRSQAAKAQVPVGDIGTTRETPPARPSFGSSSQSSRRRLRSSVSVRSAATIMAQQLEAKAVHARRLADIEAERDHKAAERDHKAAERERIVSELELQAELAVLETSSRQDSNSFVESWVNNQSEYNPLSNINKNVSYVQVPRANSDDMEAAETSVHEPPCAAPLHSPLVMPVTAAGHPARSNVAPSELHNPTSTNLHTHLRSGTQKHNDYNKSKDLLLTNTHNNNDFRLLAQVITDIASTRPKVSEIKLPKFDGRVADWLAFKRAFDESKIGFTVAENLSRLNYAIRGTARDSVSTLLVSARDPEEVLSALELRFARPEFIVLQEIAAVRALPKLPPDNCRELNLFACRVRTCVETIKLLRQSEYLASPELSNAILSKLTTLMRTRWIDFASSRDGSKFKLELLADFLIRESDLQIKFGISESVTLSRQHDSNVKNSNVQKHLGIDRSYTISTNSKNPLRQNSVLVDDLCRYCHDKNHNIDKCKKFQLLDIDDRWNWVIENKVCHKCLRRGRHSYKSCKKTCEVVNCKNMRRHHSLLHRSVEVLAHVEDKLAEPSTESSKVIIAHSSLKNTLRPLLKVVAVTVTGPKGSVNTYALFDDGSNATLIDSDISTAIGAQGPKSFMRVDCMGGLYRETDVSLVNISIKGKYSMEIHKLTNVRSIPNLGVASQTLKANDINSFSYLSDLVENLCYDDAKPMLIIGIDNWFLSISRLTRQGTRNQPAASLTALGWVLYGFTCSQTTPVYFVNHVNTSEEPPESDKSLDTLINDYYKLDSIGISKKEHLSVNEEHALQILETTSRRMPSGRFEVGLLWRPGNKSVPNSYDLALSRFHNLEKRFLKDEVYAKLYRDNVNAAIDKGYAELCTRPASSSSIRWYLPHFGVVHPHKRKLRVVYDAVAKIQGVSFNSLLLSGPDILQPLLSILMRFRENLVALCADIREMFPQIKIRPEDRDAQRFLWRDDPSQPVKEYRMSSMIFGATSSPCTAIFLKNKNAEEYRDRFPDAVNSIICDHYMDDFLGSVSNVAQAAQLAADIVTVHKAAGFEMRTWVSNCKEALSLLPPDLCAIGISEVGLGPSKEYVRVLGVTWNLNDDTLCFLKDFPDTFPSKLTKRIVLSQLMRVYDPLGFLTPIIIKGRIIFQQTWRLEIEWDQNLPCHLVTKWRSWFDDLQRIKLCSIPRCYITSNDLKDRQLHVFADASELAYACVAYWRFLYFDGNVKVSLIGGKARVAQIKITSIPRLELQAALMATRFSMYITEAHKLKASKLFLWSDSLTVLKWLRSDTRTFKPFVAHRVGEISDTTDVENWKYVPSALNVADDATRGDQKFEISSRWFVGPPFLLSPEEGWPTEPSTEVPPVLEELKRTSHQSSSHVSSHLISLDIVCKPLCADPLRFSSWIKFLRVTARAHKFLTLLQRRGPKSISAEDIRIAEIHTLRQSQLDSFPEEITMMRRNKPLHTRSRLYNLSPIIDNVDQLLHLSGRINRADGVGDNIKSPIILDSKHPAVLLLLSHFHRKAVHGNTETIVNEIRQTYWILHLRGALRSIAHACQVCRLLRAQPFRPPVGDLPGARLAHHQRPFSFSGLDYFGPVQVTVGRRREKRYVGLFTCLVTRALHLEVVHSLSSDAAIMCLRRFIARRGTPTELWSDNGTAFVGANRELKILYNDAIADFAANERITWKFIPPSAPFMGGCWERLVRSVKTSLKATLRERAPSDEVLQTLLSEAEALINSRPLTHVPSDSSSQEALTPFHFLLQTSSGRPIPATVTDDVLTGRAAWRKSVRLADHFWKRWVREYLPTLTPRGGGGSSSIPNVQVGDPVLIADGNLPRGTWPRGRVTHLYPGRDGIIRVADVCTSAGVLKRPLKKLVPIVQRP